jgi:hypothetical protein
LPGGILRGGGGEEDTEMKDEEGDIEEDIE